MPWSRITFAGGFDAPDSVWVGTVFQHLYEHASDEEFDLMALYRMKGEEDGITLVLSPRATDKLTMAMSRFALVECERPATEAVDLMIGAPLAWSPEWCEMSLADRLAEAEIAYLNDIELAELVTEAEDHWEVPFVGTVQ